MMNLDAMRVRAVVRKELRDYRRKRSIVVTMGVLPLLFLLQPVTLHLLGHAEHIGRGVAKQSHPSHPLSALDPDHHAEHSRRVHRGRRARAGNTRTAPHHASPPAGVPSGQGGVGHDPHTRALLHGVRPLPRRRPAGRQLRCRLGRVPRQSGHPRFVPPLSPYGRLGHRGRHGDVSQGEPKCESPSSSACWRAFPRWA